MASFVAPVFIAPRCCGVGPPPPAADPFSFEPRLDDGVLPSPLQRLSLAQARRVAEGLPRETLVAALDEAYAENLALRNWILRAVNPAGYAAWRRGVEGA